MALTFTGSLVLILVSLAAGCSTTAGGGAADDGTRGAPLELERMQVGSVYGIGSHFSSDGIDFTVERFGVELGNTEIGTTEAAPSKDKEHKKIPKTLLLSHATLRCQGRHTRRLEFDYVDNGGPVELEIAGVKRRTEDFIGLDGAHFGSVLIAVVESNTAGVRHGHVRISGALEKFAISGSELELADVRLSD